jgi:hypothetical protein
MDENQFFDNSEEVLSNLPEGYNILEEEVNIDVQREFYEASGRVELLSGNEEQVSELIMSLSQSNTEIEEQKKLLIRLSLCDSVAAYRFLEAYSPKAPKELKDWAILALQQSRMLIHSSLLGEQQVFISTGLGGKQGKLRYFLIFPYLNRKKPLNSQESILKKELEFFIIKNGGELEDISLLNEFATATALLPLKAPVGDIIHDIVNECNQFGNYLGQEVLVTNMRKLNEQEINEFISENETAED